VLRLRPLAAVRLFVVVLSEIQELAIRSPRRHP
jgi:hypothetical protein